MRTRYFLLEGEPGELEDRVDVDAILERVRRLLGLDETLPLTPLTDHPARIKVMRGDDIEAVAQAVGTTSGFAGACRAAALFLPPSTILVCRLDWAGTLGHEMTHLLQRMSGRPMSEDEARWVEDQV
jgi:hypothetical protein